MEKVTNGYNVYQSKQSEFEVKENGFSVQKFQQEVMDRIQSYNDDSLAISDQYKYEVKAKKGLDFNPTFEMMRIASAETIPALKRVIASLENRAAMLKNTKEGETLIPKIKRIIKRGNVKVGRLGIEERIKIAAENAMKRREYVEASNHRTELSIRKVNRKKLECDDIKNADKIADGYGEVVPQMTVIASDYVEAQVVEAEAQVAESVDLSV